MKTWLFGNASVVDIEEVMFLTPERTKGGVHVIAALRNGNLLIVQTDFINEAFAMQWCKNMLEVKC